MLIEKKANRKEDQNKIISERLVERIWTGKWISDSSYHLKSPESPVPMVFRRQFTMTQPAESLQIFVTALGIFDLWMDGQRVNEDYFCPGFTDYSAHLQYVCYEVKDLSPGDHELVLVVAGGWAVGRTTHVDNTTKSRSQLSADRQALLCDLVILYTDGAQEIIGTDENYEVTEEGPWRFGDFYDGEVYDARVSLHDAEWKPAAVESLCIHPKLCARYGLPVTAHERFSPVSMVKAPSGELIADFGQNMAGIVEFTVQGHAGQHIVIRHAEALENNELYVQNLRSAKQTLTYICKDGVQHFSPRFTYMGFRYIGITGVEKEHLEICAAAVYSDFETIGSFQCSNEDLNQLQHNLVWSGKSNFVDIPTDCPQRDERQGWTGDIALFAPAACFNFDMRVFLQKWLLDMKTEQGLLGSIPFVIPARKGVTPRITTSCWGDSCILVPWALYMSDGDEVVLREMYPVMKKYMADVSRWAALSLPVYGSPYILKLPFQFGDWCAPYGNVPDWLKKGAWVGTAYYFQSCQIMSKIAGILGKKEDCQKYLKLSEKVRMAFRQVFTDEKGHLKQEFQTAYVLALAFHLAQGEERHVMAERLWTLIKENGTHLNTGFTATPFILFALCDAGLTEEAYELLLQDTEPSWLYQLRHGATTMWEQWSSVREDGTINETSLNHYAYGAVGDFFYRRICGLEAVEPGYRRFLVKPIPGGGLYWAECTHLSPFGLIRVRWEETGGRFRIRLRVPAGTQCELVMPNGERNILGEENQTIEGWWECEV